jgi:hypothetical protein
LERCLEVRVIGMSYGEFDTGEAEGIGEAIEAHIVYYYGE